MNNQPTDLIGITLQEGALVAMATLHGRSAILALRVIAEVTDDGRVKVRGLGGADNPITKASFISYPERLVHLESCWAEEWETRIIVAAKALAAGKGMVAPRLAREVDLNAFIVGISDYDYECGEPEFFECAVRSIIEREAMAEWSRAYAEREAA